MQTSPPCAAGVSSIGLQIALYATRSPVILVLADGESLIIQRFVSFDIRIDQLNDELVLTGETTEVSFTLEGAVGDINVYSFAEGGWISSVEMVSENEGILRVTAPKAKVNGKVLVIAECNGHTRMKALVFNKGILSLVTDYYEIDYNGGIIEVPLQTNLEYHVEIADESAGWLSHIETKSLRNETLVFNVESYDKYLPGRTALVRLSDDQGHELQTFVIYQHTNIIFEDPLVREILINSQYDINNDKQISYTEATKVENFHEIFQSKGIRKFNEMQYFTSLNKIDSWAFAACRELTELTMPSSLDTLHGEAFRECTMLQEVIIPEGVEYVGAYAFFCCSELKTAHFPSTITEMTISIFTGCSSLHTVTMSEDNPYFTMIDGVAFSKDKTILIRDYLNATRSSYVIPDHVIEIGGEAFREDGELVEIIIPEGVEYVRPYAFFGSEKLERAHFSSTIKEMPISIFTGCISLHTVTMSEDNPYFTIIDGVAFSKDKTILIRDYLNSTRTAYVVPGHVTEIGGEAFRENGEMVEIIISEGVEKIDGYAFNGCGKLKNVIFPSTLNTVGISTFSSCESLNSVTFRYDNPNFTIDGLVLYNKDKTKLLRDFNASYRKEFIVPEGVVFLGSEAFRESPIEKVVLPTTLETLEGSPFIFSDNLKDVTCLAVNPPQAYDTIFPKDAVIKVPSGSVQSYRLTYPWSTYKLTGK